MTSIYDIPYEDIEIFLNANNEKIPNNINKAYNNAFKLIKDKNSKGHTINIIEWIIAHNVFINKIEINDYSIGEIDNMDQSEIHQLAKTLGIKCDNRNNIINILRYLNKLNDSKSIYNTMLPEIMQRIALNSPYNDIVSNCMTSKIFNENICRNEHFWKLKTKQNYPNTKMVNNWKQTYKIASQKLYTFGDGSSGQLGHGNNNGLNIPTLVKPLENVTFVSCGGMHSGMHTAVISNELLYTFGNGDNGQLGHSNNYDLNIPTLVEELENVTSVSCGYEYTCLLYTSPSPRDRS